MTRRTESWADIEPFEPAMTVLAFDVENSIKTGELYCIGWAYRKGGDMVKGCIVGTEEEQLDEFERLVKDVDPDVITAYNASYDIGVCQGRSKVARRQPLSVGRGGGDFRKRGQTWRTPGRVVIDAWKAAVDRLKPQRETLDFVANLMGLESKLPVDASKIDWYWEHEREQTIEYCIHDAWLALAIIEELRVISWHLNLGAVARLPLDETMGKTSTLIDSLLIPPTEDEGWIVPMNRYGEDAEESGGIEGGVVFEATPGTHPRVIVLDFASMYPTAIKAHNLCFTTKVPPPRRKTRVVNKRTESFEVYIGRGSKWGNPFVIGKDGTRDEVIEKYRRWIVKQDAFSDLNTLMGKTLGCFCKPKRCHGDVLVDLLEGSSGSMIDGAERSPCGAWFLQETRGIIPRVMEDLGERRDATKALRDEHESGTERYRYYDDLQVAIKINSNAFYGVLASSFYRFTDPEIGESITLWSQHNIRLVARELEEDGFTILYGDTDSVFVASNYETVEESIKLGLEIGARYTREGGELEFEKLLDPMFTHGAKKRYVGRIVWPKPGFIARGYEIRRTDSFELLTSTLRDVFDHLLDYSSYDAIQLSKRMVAICKKRDEVDNEGRAIHDNADLIISRRCRNPKDYAAPQSQLTVQAARKRLAAGYEFTWSTKIAYIVTNGSSKPKTVEPVLEGQPIPRPDPLYYARRMSRSLGRVIEEFGKWDDEADPTKGNKVSTGWDEEALLKGRRQTSLFEHEPMELP
jgi:DNA polymerase elongation subunit (family B)